MLVGYVWAVSFFSVFFMSDAQVFFYLSFFIFHFLGGGDTGNLHIVTFYLILDACFYYISPYGDGEANRGSKRMFLGFGYCFFFYSFAFSFR